MACPIMMTGCGPPAGTGREAKSDGAKARLRQLVDSGRQLHDTLKCAACHAPEGQPSPGPSLKDIYGRPARLWSGKVRVRDEAYLTLSITDPLADVLDGYSPTMPPYQHLDPEQVSALVHFIKSLTPETEEARASRRPDEAPIVRPTGSSP